MIANIFRAFLSTKLESGGSETVIYLDRVTTLTGETITTSDFSDFSRGIITVNPDGDGVTSYPEYISFTAVSGLTLTGAIRGLSALSNSVVSVNKRFHPVDTPVILSFGGHNIQDLLDYVDAQVGALTLGSGTVVVGTAGEILAAGNLVYLKDDGKWWKTDADTAATLFGVQLGIAQGSAIADGAITNGVLRKGIDANQSAMTAGDDMFAGNTAGAIVDAAGTNERKIGVARSATNLYFDPEYSLLPTASQKQFINAFTGMIAMYVNATPPTGFLACDGSAVSRTTYADLFAVISTSYGVGDGSTTFNLPDLRGSVPLGAGTRVRTMTFDGASAVDPTTDIITVTSNDWLHTGQAVALTGASLPTGLSATTYYVIRLSATTISLATSVANANEGIDVDITADGSGTCTLTQTLTARTVGQNGGEETHALTNAEMPSHRHNVVSYNSSLGGSNDVIQSDASRVSYDAPYNTDDSGSDTPHNSLSPYTVVQYIIKT